MYKVGLTGGIGSGKTTVSKVFATLGVPVFYADIVASQIIYRNETVIEKLKEWYGNSIYLDNGSLNKERFAIIIFNNEADRLKVNALIHPLVIDKFNEWAEQQKCQYVINEAALHFETGNHRNLSCIITVTAPADLRLQRIEARDNRPAELIKKIMAQQLSEDYKTSRSNFVINNSGHLPVLPQVLQIHNSILAAL